MVSHVLDKEMGNSQEINLSNKGKLIPFLSLISQGYTEFMFIVLFLLLTVSFFSLFL